MHKRLLVVPFLLVLASCPKKPGGGGPAPSNRCEVDLLASGLFKLDGSGASAHRIEDPAELIGGQSATGRAGDYLLQNDRVRVVIDQPGRNLGVLPYGGNVIDADLVRPAGAGADQLGKLGNFYAMGRTVNVQQVEVLADGSGGGPAIIAATGHDDVADYINIVQAIRQYVGQTVKLVFDADAPLPLNVTTYYVLSPGEERVRILTAFCNTGEKNISIPVGDMFEQGGTTDFFNPGNCKGLMGGNSCLVDPAPWWGFQGDQVAYGYRSYQFDDLATPAIDAVAGLGTITVTSANGEGSKGVLTWLDPDVVKRPGTFGMRAGSQKLLLRDLVVAPHLGGVSSFLLAVDGAPRGRLEVTATLADGTTPAPFTRVSVATAADERMVSILVTDSQGKAWVELPPGSYHVVAGRKGHLVEAPLTVAVAAGETSPAVARLGVARKLTITVKDPAGGPLPAKVTVFCEFGSCPVPLSSYQRFYDLDAPAGDIAALELVPPQGSLELALPPGEYRVLVSRGPEYSVFPDAWPLRAEAVDLRTADARRDVVLARVVDSAGWMSSDLHVHAANSSDSSVRNEQRVLQFAAEGVDVLCSTDHDFITDYAPVVRSLGAEPFMASMIGEEITSFDFGHFNAYPIARSADSENGGAFDWAGGEGPTLRPGQILEGVKLRWPDAFVQANHPRSMLGPLKADTATGASHAEPGPFRMEPDPLATPANTRVFSEAFDGYEVQNGLYPSRASMNGWMTFLSRGLVKTATAVSDTHYSWSDSGGYGRTYVDMGGRDAPAQFDTSVFSTSMKAHRAFCTNGPFMKV
ncbi:MAG: CehA/McbA family metallohydrolase, partial [Myxococcaceae bacterium]